MESTNFTIDLVSNGSMEIFPENTLSAFQNQIDPPLDLDGDWEVALTEIYFPTKFEYDFKDKQLEVKFHMEYKTARHYPKLPQDVFFLSKDYKKVNDIVRTVNISLDDTIEEILKKLNDEIHQALGGAVTIEHYPEFKWEKGITSFRAGEYANPSEIGFKPGMYVNGDIEEIKEKYLLEQHGGIKLLDLFSEIRSESKRKNYWNHVGQEPAKCYINQKLIPENSVFAFETGAPIEEGKWVTYHYYIPRFHDDKILKYLGFDLSVEAFMDSFGQFVKKLEVETPLYHKKYINLMYVYTDIIRPHVVGGTRSELLRAVPLTTGIYKGIGYCTFEHLIYYPVRKNHIENIAIICTDDTGEQIKFANFGRVFLSLDFRKRKN